MNDWLIGLGLVSPAAGFWVGLGLGLLVFALLGATLVQRAARRERSRLQPEIEQLGATLQQLTTALAEAQREAAVLAARAADREAHHQEMVRRLEDAEKRLAENFERLAGRIFDERAERLNRSNVAQLDSLLKPLGEKIVEFRNTVEKSHRDETAQFQVMKEKIGDLGRLNERLHKDATDLSRALTTNVKAQGSWGEQQLERLLEMAGLQAGRDYSTQFSVTTESGQRVQPDLVVHLPENKSIVLDSKVSLVAWTRYQSCETDAEREAALKEHVQSIRQHVRNLAEKRYPDIPQLDALDFVLMFVPIEAALIAALQADPELPELALRQRIALLSPMNFLATMRTVASVWAVHRQNRNAQEIARRAGLLYDKFKGFVDNLQDVGKKLGQAQQSYEDALGQLSTGSGNLVRQVQQLRELGARGSKELAARLVESAGSEDPEPEAGTAPQGDPQP